MGVGAPLAALCVAPARAGGGVACGSRVRCGDEARRNSAVACCTIKMVAAASLMARGALWRALLLPGPWSQGLVVVEDVCSGFDLGCCDMGSGMGLAVGCGCCLVVGFRGRVALSCGLAAGQRFGWGAGAGFAVVNCCRALPVAGRGAAGVMAFLGALERGSTSWFL